MAEAGSSKRLAWLVVAFDDQARQEMESHLRNAGFRVVGYAHLHAEKQSGKVTAAIEVTLRECEVLEALIPHDRLEEIADSLSVSKDTVEYHLGRLMRKLGVHSRHRLIVEAQRHGLLSIKPGPDASSEGA